MKRNTVTLIWWSGLIGLAIAVALIAFLGTGSPSQASSSSSSSSSPDYHGQDPRILTLTKGTTFLADIPQTLPANGVSVEHGHIILRPLSAAQNKLVAITRQQALELAHKQFQETPGFSITIMLLASFTNTDTVPIGSSAPVVVMKDTPAWVVVYTSTTPMSLPATGPLPPAGQTMQPQPTYYHFNIALNAHTGTYLCGFFTP